MMTSVNSGKAPRFEAIPGLPGTVVVFGEAVEGPRFQVEEGRLSCQWVNEGDRSATTYECADRPTRLVRDLDLAGAKVGASREDWEPALRSMLAERARRIATTLGRTDMDRLDLAALIGALRYPLLGEAYRRFPDPLPVIPDWAENALSHAAPGVACRRTFTRSQRPLAKALAASLVPEWLGQVTLTRLGFALATQSVLPPEKLAAVLSAVGPGAARANISFCDLDSVAVCVHEFPSNRVARLIVDCIERASPRDVLDRFAQLAELRVKQCVTYLPRSWEELEAFCEERQPTVIVTPPTDPAVFAARHPRRRKQVNGQGTLELGLAPVSTRRHPRGTFVYDPWLELVDGLSVGDAQLWLPRTRADLRQWAAAMHNCLHAYVEGVARRACVIVGVFQSDVLVAAVEVEPRERLLGEIAGRWNSELPEAFESSVIALLERCGVRPGW